MGLVSVVVRGVIDCLASGVLYHFRFNEYVAKFERMQRQLIRVWGSVNDRVELAEKEGLEIADDVLEWLEKAKSHIDEVEALLAKEAANNTRCFGSCPNWIYRYRLAKQLARLIWFGEHIVYAFAPWSKEHVPWENCMNFDSRQGAYKKLMEALRDDEVIGLCGMSGCGKTTLAMELMSERLFDKIIFVPVSSKVVVRSIQDKIASKLQFQFPEDGDLERARCLHERLTRKSNYTLVILDDVRQSLNFKDIGIPFGDNCKKCKVIITTQSKNVCDAMKCQQVICLSALTDEEAWELFQKQVRIFENSPETLKELGRLISKECEGLPVAIAALAGTLKGMAEADWKVALHRLKNAIPVNIEKGLQNPYKCLELSYDNLDTKEAKSLLLLCSVFPEHYDIPVEDLTIYAIGLGLVGEVWSSYEKARDEVSAARNKLLSSNLLLSSVDDDKKECVKMHDLIRDVVQWIGSKEGKAVKCDELEKSKTSESSSIRYLWGTNLPNDLDRSCIEFLWLETNLEISDEYFKGMKMLRVLILHCDDDNMRGSLSTNAFKSLKNLRCLVLSKWELGDISFLEDMRQLESLVFIGCSFSNCDFSVITKLTKLRLLKLLRIEGIPLRDIRRHLQLEELYINEEHDVRVVPRASERYRHFVKNCF